MRRRLVYFFIIFFSVTALSFAEEKVLFFDDFSKSEISRDWRCMRMEFKAEDGRLNVVSKPRQGFNYGHRGNGRSAAVFTHIGDTNWKDYRIELDIFGGGAGEFNPHGISDCMRGSFSIYFRTINYPENWNAPSRISYAFGVNPIPQYCEGKPSPEWGLSRINGWYASNPVGWCGGIAKNYFIPENRLSPTVTSNVDALWEHLVALGYLSENGNILDKVAYLKDSSEMHLDSRYSQDESSIYFILKKNYCKKSGDQKTLVKGKGNPWKADAVNHIKIEVIGRNIKIWVNGQFVIDYVDTDRDALLFGGFGVVWEWDNTGWISNVVVTALNP